MAAGLHRLTRTLGGNDKLPEEKYVVRLHSIKTEVTVWLQPAKIAREAILPASNKPTQAKQMSVHNLVAHINSFNFGKYQEIVDDRVQHIHLALGTRIRQRVGLQQDGTFKNSDDYPVLEELYKRYMSGGKWENCDHTRLYDLSIELAKDTIGDATALCAKVAGAADSDVTEAYGNRAEVIVVDEAAKVAEYQWWPLIAFYKNAVGKIMIGDINQLRPYVGMDERNNPFKRQIELSLQERIQLQYAKQNMDTTSAFFSAQYRAVTQIAEIYNQATYNGRITTAPAANTRELAATIIRHNKENYNAESSVCFFDSDLITTQEQKSGQKYSDVSAVIIMNILEELFKDGFGTKKPCSIAILVPYQFHRKRLNHALKRMKNEYPQTPLVVLETGDEVQGKEYDIVLVDTVVTTSPGFLNRNRLNVLFSRAMNGLYVVGNYTAWQNMCKPDSLALRSFGQELAKYRMTWSGKTTSPFYDPNLFISRNRKNEVSI